MNILFISSQFPNSLEPNRGVFSYQIAKGLSNLADVKVIAPMPSIGCLRGFERFKRHKTDPDVPRFEILEAISVYHPKYMALPGLGLLHQWAYESAITSLIQEINSDWPVSVVNCHWLFPDGVAIQRICKKMGIPVMLTALGTDLNRYCDFKIRKRYIQRAICSASKVSVLSQQMFDKCISMGVSRKNLAVIPNGIDIVKFNIFHPSLSRERLNVDPDVKMVLFVGSLVPVKNVENLIIAFSMLVEDITTPDAILYVIGGGFLEKALKALTAKLRLQSYVIFIGPVLHDDLPYWMNAADCLCLPSLSEGHPNVMMESLACGTPVVGSRVGSIPDFIGEKLDNGYLLESTSAKDIASNLNKVLSYKYSRHKVRETVNNYSWGKSALQYFSELKSLL